MPLLSTIKINLRQQELKEVSIAVWSQIIMILEVGDFLTPGPKNPSDMIIWGRKPQIFRYGNSMTNFSNYKIACRNILEHSRYTLLSHYIGNIGLVAKCLYGTTAICDRKWSNRIYIKSLQTRNMQCLYCRRWKWKSSCVVYRGPSISAKELLVRLK